MNVVLDTNIIISAFLSSEGAPAEVFELLITGKIKNSTTQEIIQEVEDVIKRPYILKRSSIQKSLDFLKLFQNISEIVQPKKRHTVVKEDPDDDKFIDCAKESGSKMIITGDAHLLHLKEFEGIYILTPRECIQVLKTVKSHF